MKAQNRLVGVIANNDIYGDDDYAHNEDMRSNSMDRLSMNGGDDKLEIATKTGNVKKQPNFLDKLTKTSTENKADDVLASYGFLN